MEKLTFLSVRSMLDDSSGRVAPPEIIFPRVSAGRLVTPAR